MVICPHEKRLRLRKVLQLGNDIQYELMKLGICKDEQSLITPSSSPQHDEYLPD